MVGSEGAPADVDITGYIVEEEGAGEAGVAGGHEGCVEIRRRLGDGLEEGGVVVEGVGVVGGDEDDEARDGEEWIDGVVGKSEYDGVVEGRWR